MSQVEDMVKALCPRGVKFSSISDLFNTRNGYTPKTSDATLWSDGEIPWFRMEDIRENGRILNDSNQKVTQLAVKGDLFPANSLLVATSATIGEHALVTVPHLSNQRFTSLSLKPQWVDKLDMRFAFYYGFVLADWCKRNTTQSSFASVDMGAFRAFKFPVPPMEVQREIVRILDTFSALEAELEAELEARRIQYAYYRDELLKTYDSSKRWKTLGDIGRVAMCRRVFKKETTEEGDIPFYKIGTFGGKPDAFISKALFDNYRTRYSYPRKGEVLLSAAGTIGRAIPFDGAPSYFQDSNIVWLENDERVVLNRFLYHWYQVIQWTTDGGTIRRLYNDNLRKAKILVPSLSEQYRIVAFLDKFEALTNDLSIGLPAELAARRKQYEYYRDKLLTFKELD